MNQKMFNKWGWLVVVVGIFSLGLLARFYNFYNRAYFIYDQGRDSVAIKAIAQGDFALVGPTTGLAGLFLGPAWFYAGLPGFFLGGGNPWVLVGWYMFIGCLALPIFWLLAKHLFPSSKKNARPNYQAIFLFALLALTPGAIIANVFVWNPLLSVPLMAGAWLCLSLARKSSVWAYLGLFLIALTLQSEFAYAVFILPFFGLGLPWILGKYRQLKDFLVPYLVGGFAVLVTLAPQLLFELRNQFIMTTSLLASMQDKTTQISWVQLLKDRPAQLFSTVGEFAVGPGHTSTLAGKFLLLFAIVGVIGIWLKRNQKQPNIFAWQIGSLLFALPLIGSALWRGNHGYFFNYYLTPHFIFTWPMAIFGVNFLLDLAQSQLKKHFNKTINLPASKLVAFGLITVFVMIYSYHYYRDTIWGVTNNAGLKIMTQAVGQLYTWQKADNATYSNSSFGFFVPSIRTEHYDYLNWYYAKSHQETPPPTFRQPNDTKVYLLLEPHEGSPKYYQEWYERQTKNMTKTREEKIGVLRLESWVLTN